MRVSVNDVSQISHNFELAPLRRPLCQKNSATHATKPWPSLNLPARQRLFVTRGSLYLKKTQPNTIRIDLDTLRRECSRTRARQGNWKFVPAKKANVLNEWYAMSQSPVWPATSSAVKLRIWTTNAITDAEYWMVVHTNTISNKYRVVTKCLHTIKHAVWTRTLRCRLQTNHFCWLLFYAPKQLFMYLVPA